MTPIADLETDFAGGRKSLFRLCFKTSLLTILTLGFYRFWMKTRLRRWYWSAVRPGGHPLEYTGDPGEKLLGFLIAVAFLAFFVGAVNLILTFLSFSFLGAYAPVYPVSLLGLLPLYFHAQYRARRYILARTRWRGIRFAAEPAAWSYAAAALWNWGLAVLSLGLLWPRATWRLEKFRADRTWYGDRRLHQGGNWKCCYPAARHMLIGVSITILGIAAAAPVWFQGAAEFDTLAEGGAASIHPSGIDRLRLAIPVILAGAAWTALGFFHYRVASFRILSGLKTLDGGARLRSEARTWRVIGILIGGNFLANILLVLLLISPLMILAALFAFLDAPDLIPSIPAEISGRAAIAAWTVAAAAYFGTFALWGTLRQVFVHMPVTRHFAETLTVLDSPTIFDIRQREAGGFGDAEGFAEALDVDAAI